jgi:hypothetical protein
MLYVALPCDRIGHVMLDETIDYGEEGEGGAQ